MRLINADDLYQKCIEIQLKKRNRYFDIDDVMKLIKKAPTVDVLDKIRAEIDRQEKWLVQTGYTVYNVDIAFNAIKAVLAESEDKERANDTIKFRNAKDL